jgi:homoserine O-acetyltransferase
VSTGSFAAPAATLDLPGPFVLESGARLPAVRVAYRTWGTLDAHGGNAVLVCHALTGSADVDRWWGSLPAGTGARPGARLRRCSNVLGGCWDDGPTSLRPDGAAVGLAPTWRPRHRPGPGGALEALGVKRCGW